MGVVWTEFCTLFKYFSAGNTENALLHITSLLDHTMTVDNVTQVLSKIEGDRWAVIGVGGLHIPKSQLEETIMRCTDP